MKHKSILKNIVFCFMFIVLFIYGVGCGNSGNDSDSTTAGFSSGSWGAAVNMGPTINTANTEKAPAISPDGKELYFFSEEPGGTGIDIYISEWDGASWSAPTNQGKVAHVNYAGKNDVGPFISRDGLTLYFASERPGGYGKQYDLYTSTRSSTADNWGVPVNMGSIINSAADSQIGPTVSGDGNLIFFSRGWPESQSSSQDENLYYSRFENGSWTTPVFWEQNTPEIEDNPELSPDGTVLYLTVKNVSSSATYTDCQDFDIYASTYTNGQWSKPVNVGSGVNDSGHDGNPSLSADGKTLYFTSQDRADGYGGFDLYYSIRQ